MTVNKKRSRGPTRRKDWLWQQAITYQGKRKHLYGKTRQEVINKVTVIKGKIAQGTYRNESRMTLAEWMPIWMTHKRRRLADSSLSNYERQIKRHILPSLGQHTLDRCKPYILQQFIDSLPLAPETIRLILRILSAAFQHAVNLDVLPSNPAKGVTCPGKSASVARPLTMEEIQMLITANQGHRLFPAVLLGCCMGLRRGEILALQWHDIDMQQRILHVRHSLNWRKSTLTLLPVKSATSRRVLPMPHICHQGLQGLRAQDAELALQVGRKLGPTTYVFHQVRDGRPISPNVLQYQLNQMCDKAGISRRRIHDLRHTFGTLLAKLDESPLAIQKLLGHSSIAITTALYTHTNPTDYDQTMQRLDRALSAQ